MTAPPKNVRIFALQVLLAHFPNPRLLMPGIEQVHGEGIARELPREMERLRARLTQELRDLKTN